MTYDFYRADNMLEEINKTYIKIEIKILNH